MGRTPLLERMASLATAVIGFSSGYSYDQCDTGSIHCCGFCDGCLDYYGPLNDHRSCLLLKGLSEAENLEL
jgi:hypothetical protein